MKKVIVLMLAVILLVSLAACGGTDDPKPANNSQAADNGNTGDNSKQSGDSGKNDGDQKGWPTAEIAKYGAAIGTDIPAFESDDITYSITTDTWMQIKVNNTTNDAVNAWTAKLAEKGFVRAKSLLGTSAFKVDGLKKVSFSCMFADGELTISCSSDTLDENEWPFDRLRSALGENFGAAVFDCCGTFSMLEKKHEYKFSFDSDTLTVTCNNADGDLEEEIRSNALSAMDYFDDEKYVKKNFFLAFDEAETKDKGVEVYVDRDGSNLTVRFAIGDYPEDD